MKITPKRAQEIVQVLDDIKEACFKQGKDEYLYPFAEWEWKRERVKQRLRNLPEYIEQVAEVITFVRSQVGEKKKVGCCEIDYVVPVYMTDDQKQS